MSSILFENIHGVAKITLNRPAKMHSFNREMALSLQTALKTCADDPTIRAIIITGSGKAFCAGQDLEEVIDPHGPGMDKILKEHYNPIIAAITALPKPVIAAVNGVAAGAGANIALACDIVIAHENASFIQAFSKIGLIPDSGGTWFLPRLIGWQRALALAITGDKVPAAEAATMGMIYKVYQEATYEQEVMQLAQKLAKMPTKAIGYIKKAFGLSAQNSLEQQLELEDKLQSESANTHDFKEGVQAFLEKRLPEFKGA